MFQRILIANRGEIAVRILRACRELGVDTVAVYSSADADALHVQLATQAVCIGPAKAADSYLNVDALLTVARQTGCDALHPGYGFLSENAEFAQRCADLELTFIGPSGDVIRTMGNKAAARALMQSHGVPVVPGSDGPVSTAQDAQAVAEAIGYPVLVKASAGGGGRGMRRVDRPEELVAKFEEARAEALACFGDGQLYLEKLILNPRHIEFQILADRHGAVIHLGERDCSIQRKNQKLVEESPSKALTVQEYNREPKTMGAFANGYPNRTLAQFKELHAGDVRGISGLTEDEYKYATQLAVWATCGQLAVPGTSFTAGRDTLTVPTSDAQKIRIFDSVKAILTLANGWSKHLYTGMYLRAEENKDVRGVEVIHERGLEGAAETNTDGIKKETINGKEYYTHVMYVASATSTWIDDRKTKVYSTDAPSGTIFVAENNSPLETVQENGATCYKVDTSKQRTTNLNANGSEYYGAFKVCIPVDTAADEGSFTIKATGGVAQAIAALTGLGYTGSEAAQAIARLDPSLPVQELIRLALQGIGKGR
mgnify:CR=1 FL=1